LTHDLHDGPQRTSGVDHRFIGTRRRKIDRASRARGLERSSSGDLFAPISATAKLPLALANFRERLVPQLHRLGVELDWSIAGLPEVSGVTPGNALAILRILQEAITNALKYGPARKIGIRGAVRPTVWWRSRLKTTAAPSLRVAAVTVSPICGDARSSCTGKLQIEAVDHGTKLTLLIPSSLPDFEDEASLNLATLLPYRRARFLIPWPLKLLRRI